MGQNLLKIPNKSNYIKVQLKTSLEDNDKSFKFVSMDQKFNENEIKSYFKIFGKIIDVNIKFTQEKQDPLNNKSPNIFSKNANNIQIFTIKQESGPKLHLLPEPEYSNLMLQAYFADAFQSKQAVLKLNEISKETNTTQLNHSNKTNITNNIPFSKDGKRYIYINDRLMEILEDDDDAMQDHQKSMQHVEPEVQVDEDGYLNVQDNKTGKVTDGKTKAHVQRQKTVGVFGFKKKKIKSLKEWGMKVKDKNRKSKTSF